MSQVLLISVVDDDESVRSGTACLLRSAGYVTESFASAEEFFGSGDCHRFACVIADIHMRGMDGIELANRLGRDEQPTPVILVTAQTDVAVLANAATSAASFLLRKPFAADRLLKCVRTVTR